MDDPPAQPVSNAKIMELDDTIDNENSYQTFTNVLDQVKTLFNVMEKVQSVHFLVCVYEFNAFV